MVTKEELALAYLRLIVVGNKLQGAALLANIDKAQAELLRMGLENEKLKEPTDLLALYKELNKIKWEGIDDAWNDAIEKVCKQIYTMVKDRGYIIRLLNDGPLVLTQAKDLGLEEGGR